MRFQDYSNEETIRSHHPDGHVRVVVTDGGGLAGSEVADVEGDAGGLGLACEGGVRRRLGFVVTGTGVRKAGQRIARDETPVERRE